MMPATFRFTLLVMAYILRWHINIGDNALLGTFAIALRSMIHMVLFAVWFKTLMHRVAKPNIRKLLGSVAIMMLFWLFVKTVKHEFCISNSETIVRYLWYCFYIKVVGDKLEIFDDEFSNEYTFVCKKTAE